MSVVNNTIGKWKTSIKKMTEELNLSTAAFVGNYTEATTPYRFYLYTPILDSGLVRPRSKNLFSGSMYDDSNAIKKITYYGVSDSYESVSTNFTHTRFLKLNNRIEAIVTYNQSSYRILLGDNNKWLKLCLDHYYDNIQEYIGDSPVFPAPTDFAIVKTSADESERVYKHVLLVSFGSGCIEILVKLEDDETHGKEVFGDVFHRFLSGGNSNYTYTDVDKKFYTDTLVGDWHDGGVLDYITGDENRNSALSVLAPAVIENSGADIGNINNDILDNLSFYYYTKPIKNDVSSLITSVFAFDSSISASDGSDIVVANVASGINNRNNTTPFLYNAYLEFPSIDFTKIVFKFDFSNLLAVKEEERGIGSYINNNYTCGNFDADDSSIVKLNNRVLFDSIGLFDIRYYDRKLKSWMSTNITSESYYSDIYASTKAVVDPLGIIADVISDSDGYITSSGLLAGASTHYNPFYDYANCELQVAMNESGMLDYSDVKITMALKSGFANLLNDERTMCDSNCHLVYALSAIDNAFEVSDKSIKYPPAIGRNLMWIATPPIVQHVGSAIGNTPSVSQFKIANSVFSPSETTINYGAALHGNYSVEVFRCLKSVWVE